MGLPAEGLKLLVLVSVFWALAIVAVILRICARVITRQPIVFNDWAIFIALIFTSALAICNIVAVTMGGIGGHIEHTTFDQQIADVKIYTVVWLLQSFANTFARLSFLDFLRRIFKLPPVKQAVWIVMGLSIAYMVGCFITFFALCRPFAYNWDPTITGTCGNRNLTFLLSAIFNFLLDLTIICLPMPALWGLQMKTKQKIAFTAVFGVGAVVCVMTILRTIAVVNFNTDQAKEDFTYTVFYDALWSSLEPSLGIVCACIVLFPALFRKMGDSTFVSRVKSAFSSQRSQSSSRKLVSANSSEKWRKSKDSNGSDSSRDSLPRLSVDITHDPKLSEEPKLNELAYPSNVLVTRDFEVRDEYRIPKDPSERV